MEVSKYYLLLFKFSFYLNIAEVICRYVQSILKVMKFVIKEYFWRALGIIIVFIDIKFLGLLVPKLNLLSNGVCYNLSNYDVSMCICDIFKLSLSILFLHFHLKYFVYRCDWKSCKWLENFIIVGLCIGIFIIVLILSCTDLIILQNTTFDILIVLSYFVHYTACTSDWYDQYIYLSNCIYTSTSNHTKFKNRKYLIVTNLEKRWCPKNSIDITLMVLKDQSPPQDPRLNRHNLVSKDLNDSNHKFTSLETSQSLNCEDEYIQSTRIVRSNIYYDQPKTIDCGKSEMNKYSNKFCEYKLIPL